MEEEVPFSKEDGKQGSQKNTLGDLHNVKHARIGDETHHHYYSSRATLPKELTLSLPKINPADLVGREKDLQQLHELLSKEKRVVVVNGLGGVGKTTLAQAYTSKYYEAYKHIVWITQTSENIKNDFINTDGLLTILGVEPANPDPEQLFSDIIIKLKAIEDWPNLLIIDNAEQSLSGYCHLLPGQPNWHLLMTSREVLDEFYPKQLDFLDPQQAIELFKKHYTIKGLTDEDIRELVDAVDYHTLTIEILAKTAKVQRYNPTKLKQAIEQDLRANVKVGRQGNKVEKIGSYLSTVFNLSKLSEAELWLMKQFACLPSEFHSHELLQELVVTEESFYSELFAETIFGLAQKGWLLYNQKTDRYKIHRIIAEVVKRQHEISVDDVSDLIVSITEKLKMDYSKDNPVEKFSWVPFGKVTLENFHDSTAKKIGNLQNNLALRLRDLGDYAGARNLLEKAVQSAETNFGSEHPTTAINYSNLAIVLQDLGDYEGARDLLEKAVQSDEKNFGLEHPNTAASYSNLATVLKDLGDYAGARDLLEKAVQSAETNFGPEHPTTAISYSNLAIVLKDLGDYAGARGLLEKAVQSAERNFGPEHPNTAISYSNLAIVLKALGDYAGARDLLEKAVQSDEKNFGPEHPTTAISYSNLGTVLQDLGNYEGARALIEKAVQSDERNFGQEHPTTALRYFNLAFLLKDIGEIEAAHELSEKALHIFRKTLPEGHPHISSTATYYESIKESLKKTNP